MSAVFNNGQKDGLTAGSGDLRALRKRLWLRSSMLGFAASSYSLWRLLGLPVHFRRETPTTWRCKT